MYDSIITGHRKQLQWLHMDYSIIKDSSPAPLAKWSSRDHILCKIGMTTKLKVISRLSEWENSCKHQVLGLDPSSVCELYNSVERPSHNKSTLTKLFQALSLKDTRKTKKLKEAVITDLMLKTFVNGGFYVKTRRDYSLLDVESKIHRLLWKRYGQGLVYCHGCKNAQHEPKRHKEWFMIPIRHLPYILQEIDTICYGERDDAAVQILTKKSFRWL